MNLVKRIPQKDILKLNNLSISYAKQNFIDQFLGRIKDSNPNS
jgi:hypothetical protein